MPPLSFHLIHHTHWDREWYLPQAGFRARLVVAVRDLLELLEGDSTARFLADGQAVLIEDALAVHPEWHERVHRAVAAGQLEIGPWYILADELIPSAESLLRNLLTGAAVCAPFGMPMPVLYSPDAFGHPAVLPTLAAQFGIRSAVLWRGLGGDPPGQDRYRWIGPDGADLLVYHLPPAGYEIGAALGDDADLAARWPAIRHQLVAHSSTSQVAVFIGADHHAPMQHPARQRDALADLEPGHLVRFSTLAEFMRDLGAAHPTAPQLHGELRRSYGYTWALQGIHGTRSRLKRRYGLTELALQRRAEVLGGLRWWATSAAEAGLLASAWRTLLQCQFHDTLCGCCADVVAREQDVRLTAVLAVERELSRTAIDAITGHDPDSARANDAVGRPSLVLWNPAARPRSGVVVAELSIFRRDILIGPPSGRTPRAGPGFATFALETAAGTMLPVQLLDVRPAIERVDAARHYPDLDQVDRVRIAFEMPELSGLALHTLKVAPGDHHPAARGARADAHSLANRFVEIHLGLDGRIDLTDRRSGEHFADILQFLDEPDLGDSYTSYVPPGAAASRATWHRSVAILAAGPLVAAVRRNFRLPSRRGEVTGSCTWILHADSPLLRARIDLDNDALDHRVRLCLPVGGGSVARSGTAFGWEDRPPADAGGVPQQAESLPATEPAQRYVAAGSHDRAVIATCRGFFEYEWTESGTLLLTVLRGTGELSRGDLPTRPGHAGWCTAIPEAQELGRHVVEFAIASVEPPMLDRPDALEALWEDAFLPPQYWAMRDFTGTAHAGRETGVTLSGDGLVFTACKLSQSGTAMVLRCVNTEPVPVAGQWRVGAPISRAFLARADETALAEIPLRDRRKVLFTAPARSVVTVMIEPRREPALADREPAD